MEQDWDLGSRIARATLATSGAVLFLAGARPSSRWQSGILTPALLPDWLVILAVICALVGILGGGLVLYLTGRRRQWPWLDAGAPFLRTVWALLLIAVVTGSGTGAFAGFCMEIEGDDAGAAVMLIAAPIYVGFILGTERASAWRVSASITLGWLSAGMAAAMRLAAGGYRRYYYDEVLISTLLGLPITLAVALGVLWIIRLASGKLGTTVASAGALPLELLAREGVFVLRVEAPGLADPSLVRVAIDGRRVRVDVPRNPADTREIVFTTRPSGLFTCEVVLPREVEPRPLSVDVKDGLVSIAVAPLRAEGPAVSPEPLRP